MKKKVLSLFLVLSMMIGMLAMMPITIGAASDITITSVDDWMEKLSGKSVGAANIVVTATELDFDGYDLQPIQGFTGTFNGNGVLIKNANITTTGETGLFNCIEAAVTIENMVIKSSTFTGNEWVGSVVCCIGHGSDSGYAIIRNVYVGSDVVIKPTVTGKKGCSGGIVGGFAANGYVKVYDCVFEGTVKGATTSARYLGGIVGNVNGKASCEIKNCLVTGTITNGDSSYISGIADGNNATDSIVDNCIFIGTGPKSANAIASKVSKGTNYTTAADVYGLNPTTAVDGFTARYEDIMIPDGVAEFDVPKSNYYMDFASSDAWSVWDGSSYDTSFFADGAGTEASPYKISSAAQWVGFVKWSNKEITTDVPSLNDWYYFELTTNLKFNDGSAADWFDGTSTPANTSLEPAFDEVKAGKWGIKFNGKNHTISGVYMETGAVIGLFGNVWGEKDKEATSTVLENLIIENSYFTGSGWVGSILAETAGSTIIRNVYVKDDVYVNSTGNVSGGIVGGCYHTGPYNVTFNDCVFAGTVNSSGTSNGGIIGSGNSSNDSKGNKLHNIVIDNCLVTGSVSGVGTTSGFVGSNSNSATTTITNSIYAGKGFGDYPFGTGTAGSSVFTVEDSYTIVWGKNDKAYVTNESNESTDGVTLVTLAELTGLSAIKIPGFTRQDGEFMFPSGIVGEEPPMLRGEGTVNAPYLIEDADDWCDFVVLAAENGNYAGQYIQLTGDIDFDGVTISKIVGFAGTLDGQNYAIKNLTMSGSSDVALFCSVGSGATIKNLVIKSSSYTVKNGNWIGTVACCTNGQNVTIQNIYVDKDVTITAGQANGNSIAGGILGGVYGSNSAVVTIDNCVFAGTISATGDYVGGIIGTANQAVEIKGDESGTLYYNTVTVSNCLNVGRVATQGVKVAGIAATEGVTIENCVNAGLVSGERYVGGIYAGNPKADVVITNCYSYGLTADYQTGGGGTVTDNGCSAYSSLGKLVGNNANVPSTFTKRDGDFAVPAAMDSIVPMLLTQQMYDGASVRFDSPTGIRFSAILGGEYFDSLKENGTDVTYGIIIAPTDYVDEAGAFTIDALDDLGLDVPYVIVPADILYSGGESDGYYEFRGVLGSINEYNYDRNFSAIAYVCVDGVYYYSAYDADKNSRSIAYVAQKAYEDTNYEKTTEYKYEIVEGQGEAGSWSPYTTSERDILLGFFGKTDAADLSFLSYNVRNVEDTSGWLDRPTYEYDNRNIYVRDYLLNYGADIIGLQEVSWLKASLGTLDWFDTLGDADTNAGLTAAGYTCVKGEDIYGGTNADKKMWNPIYFKTADFTLIANGTKWLTSTPDEASTIDGADTTKALNYVVLEHKATGEQFVYVNVHLIVRRTNYVHDANGADTEHYVQELEVIYLRAILEELQATYADLPMFVSGDFNNSYSKINEWLKNSVVGENDWDINSEGTPTESIKLSIARDQAVSKSPVLYSCTTEDFTEINPTAITEGWGAIDLWFTSNLNNGFVHVYQIVDNKTTTSTGEKYPSDHLPAKFYVTLYVD